MSVTPSCGDWAEMRAVVQRVRHASVSVDSDTGSGEKVVVGSIDVGLCVLVGVTDGDDEVMARRLAAKLVKLRIFSDADDKMNLSVADIDGGLLIISQFTLYGDARKGNRPSFVNAARPEIAEPLIELVVQELRELGATVATGRFGADMAVDLLNDGPVTLILEL